MTCLLIPKSPAEIKVGSHALPAGVGPALLLTLSFRYTSFMCRMTLEQDCDRITGPAGDT